MASDWWQTLDALGYRGVGLLLSVLWQSSILFAGIGVLTFALRRSRATVRHALWTAAVLVAPLLPGFTWLVSSVGTSPARIEVLPRPSVGPLKVVGSATLPATSVPAAPSFTQSEARPGVRSTPTTFAATAPWVFVLAGYLGGAVLILGLVGLGRLRMAIWLGQSEPTTDPRVLSAFQAAQSAVRLRRTICVAESVYVPTPLTVGSFRPVVLLPRGLAEALSDAELQSVAVHELAHVKRNDALILSLVSLVRAALFFQPLIWLAARRVSALAEEAADDAVLEVVPGPTAYAKMLVRLAEALPQRAMCTELSAGIVLRKSAFLRRVHTILSEGRARVHRLSRTTIAGVLTSALAALVLAVMVPLSAAPVPRTPPMPQLIAHRYYELGKPIHVTYKIPRSNWGPRLEEIDLDWPFVMRIDGRDFRATAGAPLFSNGVSGGGFELSSYREAGLGLGRHRVVYVFKDIDVTDPDRPGRPVHYEELATNEAEFEVVDKIPAGYLAGVYEEGWEERLRAGLECRVTDRWVYSTNPEREHPTLLQYTFRALPCDLAFDVYVEKEGDPERRRAGTISARASLGSYGGGHRDERLTWTNAKEHRWRLHFVPSRDVAMANPPIRRFYGREIATEWASFEPDPRAFSPMRKWEMLRAQAPASDAATVDRTAQQTKARPIDTVQETGARRGTPSGIRCLHFDGRDDHLSVPHSESLALTPPFTIEMWLKPDASLDGNQRGCMRTVLGKTASLGDGKYRGFALHLGLHADRPQTFAVCVDRANNGPIRRSLSGYWLGGEWLHLAVRVGSSGRRVYVNGTSCGSDAPVPQFLIGTTQSPLLVGSDTGTAWSPFKGHLRDLRIWKVARSDRDIRKHMTRQLTGKERGLVAFWPFHEGQGQVARDRSPNQNDAVLGSLSGPDEADPKWVQ